MKCSKITSTTALLDSYLTLQLLFRSVCSVSASTDPSYQPVYSSPPPDETNPRDDGKLGSLFKSYVDLPPLGKFITGIFVGFIVTRIIMRSALRLLKLLVAVFIVVQLLHYFGIFEMGVMQFLQEKAVGMAEYCASKVSSSVSPPEGLKASLRALAKKEWFATMGFALGALMTCLW